MTIASTTNQNSYTGNGSTSVFPYTYKINDEDHLEVIIRDLTTEAETTLTITTHYTVSGVGETSGGDVTTEDLTALVGSVNLTSNYEIFITRRVPLKQTTDLENQGAYYAQTVEDMSDYLTMVAQQQQEELDRCPKTDVTSSETGEDLIDDINQAVTDAEAAQTAAETAQTNAETAETNAAASASAAASSAAGVNLPPILAGDATKILKVNAAETGHELSMPNVTSTKSANYTVTDTDGIGTIVCDTGAITITLPTVADNTHRRISIVHDASSGVITVDPESSETINGSANSYVLYERYETITIQSDGSEWFITERLPITQLKNYCINGAFDFWQRYKTSQTGNIAAYVFDRWYTWGGNTTWINNRGTGVAENSIYHAILGRQDSGSASTTLQQFGTSFEEEDVYTMRGKTMTISFLANKQSGFSPTDSTVTLWAGSSTTANQKISSISSAITSADFDLTTTATRYSMTFTVPTDAKSFGFKFNWTPIGATSSTDYWNLAEVQLTESQVTPPRFNYAGKTLLGEELLVYRYCRHFDTTIYGWHGFTQATNIVHFIIQHMVPMRSTPTFSTSNASVAITTLISGSGYLANLAVSFNSPDKTQILGGFTGATKDTTNNVCYITSGHWIRFDAEL